MRKFAKYIPVSICGGIVGAALDSCGIRADNPIFWVIIVSIGLSSAIGMIIAENTKD